MPFEFLLIALALAPAAVHDSNAPNARSARLEGQPNFRDVGGCTTDSGKTVRRGLVFRSGELGRLADKDVVVLKKLGVKTVVNFLTEDETKERGEDRLPQGAREVRQPIETEGRLVVAVNEARRTADFSKLPPSVNPEIHRMLVNEAKPQYAALLREIANGEEPLVFHCSHGVHRTGTATAILLWGLGVPWKAVREEYLLSNQFRKKEVEKRLANLRDLAAENRQIAPEDVDMTNIRAFYLLEGKYIDAARDEILSKHGSIGRYLTEGLGLRKGEIQRLRQRLLE